MKAKDLLQLGDPWVVFKSWYDEVAQVPSIKEPTAMTLATADTQGRPSARTVLLKKFSEKQGFVFFTNYDSQKGHELGANKAASLLFYWDPLFRQIRIDGEVDKIPRQESIDYWNSRPWDSQVAGWLSKQSQPVSGSLTDQLAKAQSQWKGQKVPCPENWGGYALIPRQFEFWVGHKFRLHDRVQFLRQGHSWAGRQLYP